MIGKPCKIVTGLTLPKITGRIVRESGDGQRWIVDTAAGRVNVDKDRVRLIEESEWKASHRT